MKLSIIGAGKIARALVSGLLREGFSPTDIIGVARSEESRKEFLTLNSRLGWTNTVTGAVEQADVVILAVKPIQFVEVVPPLAAWRKANQLFISVAAGITISRLEGWLGSEAKIIRAMPNTPCLIGQGVIGLSSNSAAREEDIARAEKLFLSVGKVFKVKESLMDAVTALSGSGPAYFYLFVDCLRQAGVTHGLDPADALAMAIQTALGSASMLKETDVAPDKLIEQVKSKGGTTEAALDSFAESGMAQIVLKAFTAAVERSQELSRK